MRKESDCSVSIILFRIIGLITMVFLFVFVAGCTTMMIYSSKPIEEYYYETTEIEDYGKYIGNNDNGFAQNFITSFFPEAIRDEFSEIIYSYRAENFDIYGFEAYLEFKIEDKAQFNQYITSLAPEDQWKRFQYDNSYMEYTIADELELSASEYDGEAYVDLHIMEAEIGKILYSALEQKIIYIAIAVYDGGGVTTEFLCKFFERFNIDPLEYEASRNLLLSSVIWS